MKLSPTEIFTGKKIFFIGGTGFVGKVTLSMLLHNFPDIGRVYATVRARDAKESEIRFWTSIVTSPTFDPLRKKYGDEFEDFIRSKVVPVNGDCRELSFSECRSESAKIMRIRYYYQRRGECDF
jgi:long-chain acyl-CoA synthetase